MNQQSEHLSDAQIEQFGELIAGAAVDADRNNRLEMHLADCTTCRERLLASQRSSFIRLSDFSVSTAPHAKLPSAGPDCPGEDALRDLAAGLYSAEQAAKLTQHVAQCDHCGPVLRRFAEDFSEELNPADHSIIAKTKNSSSAWQETLSKRMLAESVPRTDRKRFLSWRWLIAPAAVTVCALIGFGVWYSQRETPEKVEKLLAQAYTENRQLDMRIPFAKHADVHQQRGRGSETSYAELPRPFLVATEVIASKLEGNPRDPRWLLLKARLDILQGLYEPALKSLDMVHAPRPSAEYHLTRALALSQESDKESNRELYSVAVDELSAALAERPDDAVVLFDRALEYEKLGLLKKSSEDWERFLQVEQDSAWRQEGAQRKEEVDKALHRQISQDRFSDPRELISLPANEADRYVEQYQDAALRSWVLNVLSHQNHDLVDALAKLANLLSERHGDKWLRAFTTATSSEQLPAVRALVQAIQSNEAGRYAAARQSSQRAAALFRHFGNRPGAIRSLYEEVYADHRSLRASTCLARASMLREEAARYQYQWLHVQLSIETAICFNFTGNLSKSNELLAFSQDLARSSRFPILRLRQIGIAAGIARQQGKCDEAWDDTARGLALYWQGTYPNSRLYQLYMVMGLCAGQEKNWGIAETLQREAISLLEESRDPVQVAVARLTLVNLLLLQQRYDAAETEIKEAQRIFASAPHDPLNDTYRFSTMIDLAVSQLHQGNAQVALASLRVSEPLLTNTQGYFISLPFYRVRADAHLRLGHIDQAISDYGKAIRHAETLLQTLHAETDRLRWLEESDRSYRGLVLALLKQNEPEKALQMWEWSRSRSFDYNRIGLSEQNTRLPIPIASNGITAPGPNLRLIYAVFDDGFQLWSLGEQGLSSYWISIPRVKLESMVREFEELCSSPSSSLDNLRSSDSDISNLLLKPIGLQLSNTAVVTFELDEVLANLPMEALTTPAGEYLGVKYSLVYSPGFFAESLLRQTHSLHDQTSVVILRPQDLRSIAGYTSEKDAISGSFPRTRIVQMEQMPRHRELQAMGTADIAHFVAHGRQDGSGTALVVSASPPYLLRAEDFRREFLQRLQLAVLAACSSGASHYGLMDPQNLVHAFMSGGVPTVIASRWNVESESTAHLMAVFYKHLGQGESAPKALNSARKEVISVQQHPYFWAGFSVNGRSR